MCARAVSRPAEAQYQSMGTASRRALGPAAWSQKVTPISGVSGEEAQAGPVRPVRLQRRLASSTPSSDAFDRERQAVKEHAAATTASAELWRKISIWYVLD
ncbi:hypothetical protein B0T14DRAFT_498077 [Immersiella caudata]|uniref:Uncharacterized protein n=1 Tax=Immersiella caudata TaxID=314043 RepID=A0AA40BX63_9PEZI|nr:hypothetical protein B0T14DRAFT_498077 [Immersiella caudata]